MIMKAISSKVTKTLQPGSEVVCADNSGAKLLQIITVRKYKTRRRGKALAGIGSLVNCKVLVGSEKVRKQVHRAVIVRQRKEFKRSNGLSVSFEDNAAVLVDDESNPKGSLIKGPIAREVVERFQTVGKIASIVV
jgi:large subunit ribosomal protein L14